MDSACHLRGIIASMKINRHWQRLVLMIAIALLLTVSSPVLDTPEAKARMITLPMQFDYISWDLNAFLVKLEQTGADPCDYLSVDQQHDLVTYYFSLATELESVQYELQQIYADPTINDPAETARTELDRQEELQSDLKTLTPLAESILQEQVSEILVEEKIAKLGDVFPPILFHTTPLPKALILSPRDTIQQDANISLLADLTLEQITNLEEQVESATGDSALIVDVGGIGIYPTMVMRSSNLPWIVDTITHEWTHNYLTLRPLGLSYEVTPELRTMNETTAAIVGDEIGQKILARFYPEYASVQSQGTKMASLVAVEESFDYRAEMHATRVHVDELLAEGKIDEAEAYMEERRIVFVNHGYNIRKLNQAFFAFHGAYADQPGGAAGEDPVGPAVRQLRAQSDSLADFLTTIARMDSFEDLQAAFSE